MFRLQCPVVGSVPNTVLVALIFFFFVPVFVLFVSVARSGHTQGLPFSAYLLFRLEKGSAVYIVPNYAHDVKHPVQVWYEANAMYLRPSSRLNTCFC